MSQTEPAAPVPPASGRSWLTATVLGVVLATFLSDFSHEACTAVLPLYLAFIHLGPASLGLIEGLADFLVSLSKLAGGILGHHVKHKRPLAAVGYLLTALATAAIGLVESVGAILTLRCVAWVARGYRGPLRDAIMADAVPSTHYGRAYGLERAGDMLGAVAGPLVATFLIWGGVAFGNVLLWSFVPGVLAAAAFFFLTREREPTPVEPRAEAAAPPLRPRFPRVFWLFLAGVFLFGLGDFSRTFLIWLAAHAVGEDPSRAAGTLSLAVLLYALHNLVSAVAAYTIGARADRTSRRKMLVAGYALGVITNGLLALVFGSLGWLVVAIVLSGVYIAAEETLEKATVAEMLPRELRSLGFGILACANAFGDMASSLWVGFLLEVGRPEWAFGGAAFVGALGVGWLVVLIRRGDADRGAEA
jgi:MFS family permease